MKLKIGSLFSGYGGLDLATEAFFGADTVWHCEWDDAPSKVLAERWPGIPNHRDVTAVDWSAVEPVDILCGGFPCQDLSLAGRRAGMRAGTRSGLWSDFLKAITVLQPQVVVIENVRGLLSGCAESNMEPCPGCLGDGEHRPVLRALGRVLGDLADLGFDAEWGGVRASDVGAPHGRFRVFVLAYRPGIGREWRGRARLGRAGSAHGGDATLTLMPTPTVGDNGGVAARGGAGFGMPLGEAVRMLPTPAAMNPNDEEDLEKWEERRARVKAEKQNGNGFGTPLGVAVRMMPTPQAHDAVKGKTAEQVAAMRERGHGVANLNELTENKMTSGRFGPYSAAVQRWESLTREAPSPTLPNGRDGAHRLNAAFAEWMMGLPAGWVTDVLERTASLKALGNGVVPQQACAALEALWQRVDNPAAAIRPDQVPEVAA